MLRPTRADSPIIPVGGQLDLECEFSGTPNPRVQWTQDDTLITGEIAGERNISISIGMGGLATLSFASVSVEDNGEYRCIISNAAGSDSSTLQVDHIMRKLHAGT